MDWDNPLLFSIELIAIIAAAWCVVVGIVVTVLLVGANTSERRNARRRNQARPAGWPRPRNGRERRS